MPLHPRFEDSNRLLLAWNSCIAVLRRHETPTRIPRFDNEVIAEYRTQSGEQLNSKNLPGFISNLIGHYEQNSRHFVNNALANRQRVREQTVRAYLIENEGVSQSQGESSDILEQLYPELKGAGWAALLAANPRCHPQWPHLPLPWGEARPTELTQTPSAAAMPPPAEEPPAEEAGSPAANPGPALL